MSPSRAVLLAALIGLVACSETADVSTSTTIAGVSASTTTLSPTTTSMTTTTEAPTTTATIVAARACPAPVPATLRLPAFYEQWCDVEGIPLVASAGVDADALVIAAEAMRAMLAHRSDISWVIAASEVRVGLIGRNEQTTDMPEWADLNEAFPETDWNERARGLGATVDRPLVGAGEENVLCLPEDRYLGESIFVHELAHTILEFGAEVVDPSFRPRVDDAYFAAMDTGRWEGTYAATNPDEYWAEGVQSFFDTNLADDFQHNSVDTRTELETYDPALFSLIVEVFGDPPWRPACPA